MTPGTGASDGDSLPRPTRTRRWLIPAVVSATAVLAGIGGWWLTPRDSASADAPVVRLTIPSIGSPTRGPNGIRHLAISRDSSRIAYASATGLFVRRLGQKEPVTVAASGENPFFSPDGQWLAFFGDNAGLSKVPSSGGVPVSLASTTDRSSGGTWNSDGTIVFATSEGLYRVSQDGGTPTLLVKPDATRQERAFAWPQFLPDGRSVLFTILKEGPIDTAEVASLDLQTLQRTVIKTGGTAAQYTSRGDLVYASGNRLYVVPFDPVKSEIRGEPLAAPDIVLANTTDNGAAEFALADSGTLVYTNAAANLLQYTLAWRDRSGHDEPLPLAPAPYSYARISPNGSLIALDILGANRDIYIWNVARRQLRQLTDGPNEDALPVWTLDSQRLFFGSDRKNNMEIWSQAADFATPAQLEFSAPGAQFPNSFTPDGKKLIVTNEFKDLDILDMDRRDHLEPLLHSRFTESLGVVSPDSRWIAYESDELSDRYQVNVRPFPEVTGRQEQVSIDGGRFPLWGARNSGELFFVDLNGMIMLAAVTMEPTFAVGKVIPLFTIEKPPRTPSGRPYDVSPVDGRFLVRRPVPTTESKPFDITVVLNWFTELRQQRVASAPH